MRPMARMALLLGLVALWISRAVADPTLPQFQRASGFCQSAERAMRKGNLKAAHGQLDKALRILPSFPAAHMGLGHIALSEKRYMDALREYQLAKDSYAAMARALYAVRMDFYVDSKERIVALQDEIRRDEVVLYIPMRINRLEQTVEQLQRLDAPSRKQIAEPPAEIDFYIGNALFHLGRVEEAVSAWQASIDKDLESAMVYQNLAVGFWTMGRVAEAVKTVAAADRLGLPLDPALKADLQAASREAPR